MPRAAFSLIELLIVIAIVAVLAALLVPAVGLVREQSRAAVCATHLRSAGMGFMTYAGDHHGQLPWGEGGPSPAPYSWVSALGTLDDRFDLTCPAVPRPGGTQHFTGNMQTLTVRTFGIYRSTLKPVALAELPADAVMIFDAGQSSGGYNAFLSSMNMGLTFYYLGNAYTPAGVRDELPQPPGSNGTFMVQNRHAGKRWANYLFGDGRVRCLAPADLTCGDFRIKPAGRRYY